MSQFFMAMIPPRITDQCAKIGVSKSGKPYKYKQPELAEARAKLKAHLANHRPDAPMTGAVRLTTKWLWDSNGKYPDGTPKTTKPDTDNLVKMLKDLMTECGFWTDDALVAEEKIGKYWAQKPGIYVQIEEMTASPNNKLATNSTEVICQACLRANKRGNNECWHCGCALEGSE